MAIMIPDVIGKTKSDAEIKIFNWFKNDPLTSDWIVLHSVVIEKHISLIVGEADFVVIAPKYGLFVLEVKGSRVDREDGKWKFTNRHGEVSYKTRGPFEQASDSVFSIMKLIKNKFGDNSIYANILFGYGIMTPDIEFEVKSPEFHDAQIFDIRNGNEVGKFIQNLSGYCKYKFKETYGVFDDEKMPSKEICNKISGFLRPNFETHIPLIHKIDEAESKITTLTDEQYNTIDQISDNKRIVVLGGAGTGKTLIALQTLKKITLSSDKTVALFCFNANLGEWLKKYVDENFPNEKCYVGSFLSFVVKQINKAGDMQKHNYDINDFHSDAFVLTALEAFEKNGTKFDYLIVDEFQDLFSEYYLSLFDSLLKGGFKRGEWIMFADFKNQDIYTVKELNETESLEYLEEQTSFAKSRLTINCRNTSKISKEIENVADIRYRSIINQVDGIPVKYMVYENDEEQISKIKDLISFFKKEKIPQEDIVFLSPKKYEDSVCSSPVLNIPIFKNGIKSHSFSTIHSFKGLESKIIVATDIETYEQKKLLYIAYSRARTALYVFESKLASQERVKILVRKIVNEG